MRLAHLALTVVGTGSGWLCIVCHGGLSRTGTFKLVRVGACCPSLGSAALSKFLSSNFSMNVGLVVPSLP